MGNSARQASNGSMNSIFQSTMISRCFSCFLLRVWPVGQPILAAAAFQAALDRPGGLSYFAFATSTPNTYVAPNMFDRKTTHFWSGVKLTLGSSLYWCFDMFTRRSARNTPAFTKSLLAAPRLGNRSEERRVGKECR